MLSAWGRGLDFPSAARIWLVSSLGKYLPGKVWAVAGMAVMAQRAGVGAGPATGSAIILQVLALGTGAAVAALTGWSSLRAAYPGVEVGLAILLAVSLAAVGVLLWPPSLRRVVRLAAPDAAAVAPPGWAVVFGIAANTVAWLGYGVALWLLARGLLPGAGLGLLRAIAVFTASYLAGFLALFAPGGIGVREGVFILMLQGPIGIGAANRDAAQFADPERFDVARKPNRHLAFGHGDHVCVGLNVARMEGRIALGRLLARFPRIELAGAPERDRRVRFRGFRKLPLRLS